MQYILEKKVNDQYGKQILLILSKNRSGRSVHRATRRADSPRR
jgi:hypothetical protein